ncbi:MAG TPA: T9SS type A sorting domain-containing protein, partial [Candidatus Krumholzibacterium sp.]|nr:T9SS type A sorting domain-containing protein [Candidatus Krumholzibacterium sp.]
TGPQWYVDAIHLFQDNFPSALDIESTVRADMAMDIRPAGDPVIQPGDSIVVSCTSPTGGGIAVDAFGPRVYMHVKCGYIGVDGLKTDLNGSSLEGSMGTYISDDGTWTIIQADSARIGSNTPSPDRYAFDLNDSLLTRGYMVEYYFKAYDNTGASSTLPPGSETAGDYPYSTGSHLFEFTCLPTLHTGFLFVDGYDGIGSHEGIVQLYFDAAFDAAFYDPCDRFDRLGPQSGTANSLASRAKIEHLKMCYEGIYWDCGDLSRWTIPDGALWAGNKSDDCQLLIDFLDLSPHRAGIVLAGSDIMTGLNASPTISGASLMDDWAGVSLLGSSYVDLTGGIDGGGIVNPQMTGMHCLDGSLFYLFGGCPGLLGFDVFEKSENASYTMAFPDFDGSSYYSAVFFDTTNSLGYPASVSSLGFSVKDIRDGGLQQARTELINSLLRHCTPIGPSPKNDPTGDEIPAAYSLSQNYPNPFNPSTTVRFALKARGHVKIRVYDVAGRLVTTLVDEVRDAGYYDEIWAGRNDRGSRVASGVYFLRMESGEFESTKKIVLLR